MDHFRVKSKTMSATPTTSSRSHGSLQKGLSGKHNKYTAQSKNNRGTKAASSNQLSAFGLFEPSIVPISPNNSGLVRVYFGSLKPEAVYKTVLVNPQTTAKDVVAMVFESLHRLPKGTAAEDLSLQEMQESSQGTYYRVLSNSECPLVNQSKWEDPSMWSFRLSWRSKEIERKQTRTPICLTPAFSQMAAQSTEHLDVSMSIPGDLNPNNAPCGRHGTFSGHSGSTLNSPPQELSQEQQQQYIEISRTIHSLERQVPSGCNWKLQAKEEEEMEEEVVIIDMQEEEGREKPIYQNFLPLPEEEDPQANGQEFSFGKFTQQFRGKSNTLSGLITIPNSNYSNANWNGIVNSHIVRRQKSAIAHKRRLVKSAHTTVDSAVLVSESASCSPSASYSLVAPSQAVVVQEEECTLPKSSSDGQKQSSSHPLVAQGMKTSVSCPSLQERWQVLGAEISAALQMGMSGVMQRVIQEGAHGSRGTPVTRRRWHSMSSYPRKERHQRDHVQHVHVRELHPVIPEDEVSDEGQGVIKQAGGVHGEAGAPALLCERREVAANDASTGGGCIDRDPVEDTKSVDHEAFEVATEDAGDRLGITDSEKGRANNDDSTSDAARLEDSVQLFSSYACDILSSSSCRTSSDPHCSTDEGISFLSPIMHSKSSSQSGSKDRIGSKKRIKESVEFEEEVVIISFLDNNSDHESNESSTGRSSQYTNDQVSCDHRGNTCDSDRSTDGGSGVKADGGLVRKGEGPGKRDDQQTTTTSLKDGHCFAENDGNDPQSVPLVLNVSMEACQYVEPELKQPLCLLVPEGIEHLPSERRVVFDEEEEVKEDDEEKEKGEEEEEKEDEGISFIVNEKLIHKKDVDHHTTDVSLGDLEHDGYANNHSRPAHAPIVGISAAAKATVLVAEDDGHIHTQMTEEVRVNLEDSALHSTPTVPTGGRGNSVPHLCTIAHVAPDSTNVNEGTGLSFRAGISSERVATTEAIQGEPPPHDTLKPKLELVHFSSPTSFNLPLSKRDLDVDSDFLLWDGSDTGFIDDDDDFLPSTPIMPGSQQSSLTSPPIMASPITPTSNVDLSSTDSFEQYVGEMLSSEAVASRYTAGTDDYWEEDDDEGDITFGCGGYYSNEREELISPDDVPLEPLLTPEMAGSYWAQSQSSQMQMGNWSRAKLHTLLMEKEGTTQLAFSHLYVIREEPFVEEIEEREYITLHQTLWETEEEEEEEAREREEEVREREHEDSIWNSRGFTVEDGQSPSGRSLVHGRDNQGSLQLLSDFLKVPPHLLATAEVSQMSDPMQSVQASVKYTTNIQGRSDNTEDDDCEMHGRESMDDALEEAMALELDLDEMLQEDDPVSPQFQSEEFGSGNVKSEDRLLSCSTEHQSELSVPYCSSICSDDKHLEVEIRQEPPPQGQMFSDTGTPVQMHTPEESWHSHDQEPASLESKTYSNAFDATYPPDVEVDAEVFSPSYTMPHKQPIPDTASSNDSKQAHLVSPRDRALWNVSGAAVKGKLMDSMGSEQPSLSPSPNPVGPCRTPLATMDPSTCGWEQAGSCHTVAHSQNSDGVACFELEINARKGAAVKTAKSMVAEASQPPTDEYVVQGASPAAANLKPLTLQPVASFPVTRGHSPFGNSGIGHHHTLPTTKVATSTHSEV